MQSINWFMDLFGMGPHAKWQAEAVKSLDGWNSDFKDLIVDAINGEHTRLRLDRMELTYLPPVLWQITSLTSLTLDNMEVLPTEVGQLTNLGILRIESSRFESLPSEIGKLTNLTMLMISAKLKSLPPEIGLCKKLEYLYINKNPDLKELPLSLGQIPGLTDLVVNKTGISQELANSILMQCQLLRSEAFAALLPGRLRTWKALAGVEFDLPGLTTVQKIDMNEWLVRLEKTRDFSRYQAKLAKIVCGMLQSITENEEFKELFFIQVAANNECCEDRAAMSLNEIYTSWKSGAEELKIMTGVAKTLALRSALAKSIPAGERESVEIYLYYETLLKEHLCTAIEGMAYGKIGKREWIDPVQLLKSINETYFEHLLDLPAFERLAKKELKEEWEIISNKALNQLTEQPTGDDLSEAVLAWQYNQGLVMQERQRAWSECVKRWYLHAVN